MPTSRRRDWTAHLIMACPRVSGGAVGVFTPWIEMLVLPRELQKLVLTVSALDPIRYLLRHNQIVKAPNGVRHNHSLIGGTDQQRSVVMFASTGQE